MYKHKVQSVYNNSVKKLTKFFVWASKKRRIRIDFRRKKSDPNPDPAGKRDEILPYQEDGQREDCDGSEANIF
jgi:hypothetical protein